MRFVAVLAIVALWGCSKDSPKSGSCPSKIEKLFQKAIEGEGFDMKEGAELQSFFGKSSNEDADACIIGLLNDKKAWEFVHGVNGPTKMAEFESLNEGDREAAMGKFLDEFLKKAYIDYVSYLDGGCCG